MNLGDVGVADKSDTDRLATTAVALASPARKSRRLVSASM
jgi:hypothetical protein